MGLYVIRRDLIVLMIYLCAWVCATMCMHVLGLTHVVQQQQQRSAPDWIKVLLGCGCAPFVKSGFGFEIEAQGEVLCHPQEGQAEWYSSKRVREEQDWGMECLLSRCVINQHADTVISRKTYLSSSLSRQPPLHFHHLCLEFNAVSVSVIFFYRTAHARTKSEAAEQAAISAVHESEVARAVARDLSPNFYQPGNFWQQAFTQTLNFVQIYNQSLLDAFWCIICGWQVQKY